MQTKDKLKEIEERNKRNSLIWKICTTLIALILLAVLYYRNIIAFAFVNGEAVTLEDTIYLLRTGYTPKVLDEFMTQKMIEVEAKKRGIIVTEQEVEADINRIKNDLAAQGKTLTDVLKNSGQTVDEFQRNVKVHLTIYKLLSDEVDVTPEEIDKYIKENDYIYNPDERGQIEEDVKDLLFQEKLSAEYEKWIKDVKAGSEIDYFINLDKSN